MYVAYNHSKNTARQFGGMRLITDAQVKAAVKFIRTFGKRSNSRVKAAQQSIGSKA